jgi:antitoxin (DNA-binding transcriptional repressor) of toxin-antitoxin stability system
MRRLNVRELHHRTGAIIDQVADGDVIVIERRGTAVAELRPVGALAKGFPPGHWDRLKRYPKLKGDSGRYVSEDRDRS